MLSYMRCHPLLHILLHLLPYCLDKLTQAVMLLNKLKVAQCVARAIMAERAAAA